MTVGEECASSVYLRQINCQLYAEIRSLKLENRKLRGIIEDTRDTLALAADVLEVSKINS